MIIKSEIYVYMKFFKKEHGLSINKLYPCFIRSEVSKEGLFFIVVNVFLLSLCSLFLDRGGVHELLLNKLEPRSFN